MFPVKLIVIGAGSRGTTYSAYAKQHPDLTQIVGVAEPRDYYRRKMASNHEVRAAHVFHD